MQEVAIVTDSACDIPPDLAQKLNVVVAPVHVIIDGKDHRDQIDVTPETYYSQLEEAAKRGQLPTTSGSNVADMREAYEKALDLGNTVISVHVAERISVTIKSARTAKEQFFPEAPIHIVDSQQVIAGQALLVIAAAKAAQEGRSPEYILGMLEHLIPQTRTLLTVEELRYFEAGGRLTATEQLLGSLKGFVPIMRIADGLILPIEKRRTRRQAVNRMLDRIEEEVGDGPLVVAVNHARCPADARELLSEIEHRFTVEESYIIEIGPTTGTHTGPGALGIGYYPAMYE